MTGVCSKGSHRNDDLCTGRARVYGEVEIMAKVINRVVNNSGEREKEREKRRGFRVAFDGFRKKMP